MDNRHFVAADYITLFARDADPGGLAYWTNLLNTNQLDRFQVLDSFLGSGEYTNNYNDYVADGQTQGVYCAVPGSDNGRFVNLIYILAFNHCPDTGGYNSWVSALNGGVPRSAFVNSAILTAEYPLAITDRPTINPSLFNNARRIDQVATSGTINVISTTRVSTEDNQNLRWEPSSAAGPMTWAYAWAETSPSDGSLVTSYVKGSSSAPYNLLAPDGFGLKDLNLAFDTVNNRFIFVGTGTRAPFAVWYGYSTDSTGSTWVFGNRNGSQPVPVLSGGLGAWDYPSIGADASGRIIIGVVKEVDCIPPITSPCAVLGGTKCSQYVTVLGTRQNGLEHTFTGPSTVVTTAGYQGRVVAAGISFVAFIPTLSAATCTPTYIARYESSNGVNWGSNLGVGMGPFDPPNNSTPGDPQFTTIIFNAPLLAASGYITGQWAVAFQVKYGNYNNAVICAQGLVSGWDGCYYANQAPSDEFLVGTSVSAEGGFWVTYHTYTILGSRTPPLITQAFYFPPGGAAVKGATTNTGIVPTSWTDKIPNRCVVTCRAAGDFITVASNPYAQATMPFITTGVGRPNDVFQNILQDPPNEPNVFNFKPNVVPIARGADLRGTGSPVPAEARGLPPEVRLKH